MAADSRHKHSRLTPWHGLWVIALGAVVYWISQQSAPKFPTSARALTELAAAVGIYLIATLLRAERWQRILRHHDVRIAYTEAAGLVMVGYMGNNVLPARGGEFLRAYLLGQKGATKRSILGTVIAERALDAAALGLLFLAFTLGVLGNVKLPSNTPLIVAVAVVAFLLLVGLAILRFARSHHLVERAWNFLRPFATPARALLSLHGVVLLAVSLVIWGFEAGVYYMVSDAAGLGLGISGALYVMVLANLFALIPAAPGYVGTFDAAVVFAAKAAGNATGGIVTTYLLLLRFVLFVPITVLGAVVLFARYGGIARYRTARAEAEETEEEALEEAVAAASASSSGNGAAPIADAERAAHSERERRDHEREHERDVRETPAPTTV
ncbi:MAG: lysylphosphatidylglycerol synthase transmembrane domain-containing protein [Solirubrobacteraceae bacterium]|nr:MAG: hypothetical protein DLM63_05350 [Solirubrobacterales bacterium]